MCISTNDLALPEIKNYFLSAKLRGREIVDKFVNDRLGQNPVTNFRDKLPQTKTKTFAALHLSHITTSTGQSTTIKADRDLFKRLFSAAASGRKIDFHQLLSHELATVPLSLACTDGSLRKADKSPLSHILANRYEEKQPKPFPWKPRSIPATGEQSQLNKQTMGT